MAYGDIGFWAAQGLLAGVSVDTKFGINDDVDTAANEDVWNGGGDYTGFPDGAAETIEVFSSDAGDAAAGIGARTIRLVGLDENFVEQSEDVTLNGTTAVATTKSWCRMSRMFVLTAGSSATNLGTITARHTTTTANIFAAMPAGDDQTLICATTVPAGKTMMIRRIAAQFGRNTSSGSADVALRIREEGGVFRKRRKVTIGVGSEVDRHYEGAVMVPARSDVKMRVEGVTSNNSSITAEFEYFLIDD